ncbi:Omega-amidase [Hexamita inflata]|uniref:Omega-amidase n=1 Tax=Hexamita inflata TaxID=28002 RepID=A0ABP1H6N9_9EUKA
MKLCIQHFNLKSASPYTLESFIDQKYTKDKSGALFIIPELFLVPLFHDKTLMSQASVQFQIWLQRTSSVRNCSFFGSIYSFQKPNYLNKIFTVQGGKYNQLMDQIIKDSETKSDYLYDHKAQVSFESGARIKVFILEDIRLRSYINRYEFDLLLFIGNRPDQFEDTWKTLLKTKAQEEQCFVCGCMRLDEDTPIDGCILFDYNGEIVEPGPTDLYQLNIEAQTEFRKQQQQ